jgi:hypothetical protein
VFAESGGSCVLGNIVAGTAEQVALISLKSSQLPQAKLDLILS